MATAKLPHVTSWKTLGSRRASVRGGGVGLVNGARCAGQRRSAGAGSGGRAGKRVREGGESGDRRALGVAGERAGQATIGIFFAMASGCAVFERGLRFVLRRCP